MALLLPSLTEWQVFYQIIGSAAGALTGLQFVVMALIADMPMKHDELDVGEAFATPTIVHFVAVLMLAASLAAPWGGLGAAWVIWGLGGLAGLVYTAVVVRRMLRQRAYRPVLEDWSFHAVLPAVAYAGLLASAVAVRGHTREGLFGIAAVNLLLLFIGIHNAWDNVMFLVLERRKRLEEKKG